jgi:hypothetical protein
MHAPSPIRCATALSLAGHAALFLILGAYTFLPLDVDSVPKLTLTITTDSGPDTQQQRETPAHTPRETALRETPLRLAARPIAVLVAEQRPSGIKRDDAGPADPAPAAGGAQGSAALESSVADTSATGDATSIVTTTAESNRSVVPAGPPIADTTVAVEPIPTDQRIELTRRILKWAQELAKSEHAPSQLTWQQNGRVYTAVLERRAAASSTDIESAIAEITTTADGKELRTQLHLKRLAFSHFTQLVDRWDETVQLHDDEVVGRFHSNTEIMLGYDRDVAPRFKGKVTTAAGGFAISSWSDRRPREEVFPAGLETRVGRISLPKRFLKKAARTDFANAMYRKFDRDTRITFYPDGTYGWQPIGRKTREERAEIGTVPTLLIASRGTEFRVRGTLSGSVLIYSPVLITVEGNLSYAHDPRVTPEASDYLGLASDQSIEIAPPDVTGPGNLEIDAAIYARRHFTVTEELVPAHATLSIFGSLTAGTLSATEPRYATHVEFDPRFEHTRPPGFPMTNHYEVEEWDGEWRAVSGPEN